MYEASVDFIKEALKYIMPGELRDGELRDSIRSYIIAPRLNTLFQTAKSRLKELVQYHKNEIHVFVDTSRGFSPENSLGTDPTSTNKLLR